MKKTPRQKEAKKLYRTHKTMKETGKKMGITATAVWRLLNRKKVNEQNKKYYLKNQKKLKEQIKKYRAKNYQKIKEIKKRMILKKRTQGRCWQCGKKCKINPNTQRPYFVCVFHRKKISELSLKKYYAKKILR